MISEIMMKVVNGTTLTQAEKDELAVYFNQSQAVTSKISGLQRVDELTYDLGDMIAGRFISPSDPNNNDPDNANFTGTYMDENGVTGKNSGTTQFQLSSTDGKATVGGGVVVLDSSGVSITPSDTYNPERSYKFKDGTDVLYALWATNSALDTSATLQGFSFSGKDTLMNLLTNAPTGKTSRINLSSYLNGVLKSYIFVQQDGIYLKSSAIFMEGAVSIGGSIDFGGTPTGNITSGTYTPTLNNTTNVSASTAYACQYMRVGGVVTVSGMVNIDPTAAGQTVFTMSLPVSSNLANDYELAGTGTQDITATNMTTVLIRGSAANDVAVFVYNAISTAAQNVYFHFTYKIS